MSTVDFEAAADAWSALGVARLTAVVVVASVSGWTGAGLAGLSLAPDLSGIFRISLYFVCLQMSQSVSQSLAMALRLSADGKKLTLVARLWCRLFAR